MPEADDTIPTAVLDSLKNSGFPFQTAVAHVISESPGWSIRASEYPWRRPGSENDDRFLDIIATKGQFFLTVECKKTKQEIFTFLLPLGRLNTEEIEDFRCLRVGDYSVPPGPVFCEDWGLSPKSTISEFCVVSTSQRDIRLLERDTSLLIGATDAFAQEFSKHFKIGKDLPAQYLFVPVIVTNAKLYTAYYEPSEVSLETGEFKEPPEEIKPATWVRFSKAFTAGAGDDLGTRSLFVVSATSLPEFLKTLRAPSSQLIDKTSVRLKP